MKLDELQSVQSRERQTDQLQQLRSTFYKEAGEFIAQLHAERERAADRADDPFSSPEVSRLTDDINTAEQTVEAIYERRIGKIVKMASLAAADMPTDDGGLTDEERELFETMVAAIENNRGHVLDVIAGDAPTESDGDGRDPATSEPTPADEASRGTDDTGVETGVDAADIMGGGDGQSDPSPGRPDRPAEEAMSAIGDSQEGTEPSADGTAEQQTNESSASSAASTDDRAEGASAPANDTTAVDRKTVRITDDVGEIFGVDQREYDLSTDDVVTLPADNAEPLVERDAAEPLE